MDWSEYAAVLFDLDGVLTPTAEVHQHAWRQLFTDFLSGRGEAAEPYVDADYFDHIDGKPRYEGVRAFLASRDITLPEGSVADQPSEETVHGLGNRKNEAFSAVLRAEGIEPYPGSVRLLDALAERGIAVAVVSSSRNAGPVLATAGLSDRFTVVVDGVVAEREGLAGKPSPETFAFAAEQLGVAIEHAVVVEDATSGVRAGHDGGFGLTVGVDRGAGRDALLRAGADVVVGDLAELIEG